MATALRKAHEPASATREPDQGSPDVMTDPLHPMHQHLLARLSFSTTTDPDLAPPPIGELAAVGLNSAAPPAAVRMAIVFYAAVAAWAVPVAVFAMFVVVR